MAKTDRVPLNTGTETIQVVRIGSRAPTQAVELPPSGANTTVKVVGAPRRMDPEVVRVKTGFQVRPGEQWWYGDGPPPDLIVGASTGDFYWDRTTGDVFELAPTAPSP